MLCEIVDVINFREFIPAEFHRWIRILLDLIKIQGHLWKIPRFVRTQRELESDFNQAVIHGNEYDALKALKMGAHVHHNRPTTIKPIHYVVLSGYSNLIDIMMKYGADIERVSNYRDFRPIHMLSLCRNNTRKCFEKLLKHKVDVKATDCINNTLLHLMMKYNPSNIELIRMILQHDVNISAVNDLGFNILHMLALSKHTGKWIKDLFDILSDAGLNIEVINARTYTLGETPLHIAATKSNAELVMLLLRHGASLDIVDLTGLTAFADLEDPSKEHILKTFITYISLRIKRGEKMSETVMQNIETNENWKRLYLLIDQLLQQLRSCHLDSDRSYVSLYHILCNNKYVVANYLKKNRTRRGINQIEYYRFLCRRLLYEETHYRLSVSMKVMERQKQAYKQVDLLIKDRLPYLCKVKISEYLAA